MANRWPISAGNWSNPAIWSGSIIPSPGDDVYANNKLVIIDQDINVNTLRNNPVTTPAILAGGSFITSGSRTITCTLTNAGTSSIGVNTVVYGGFVNYSTADSVLIVTGSNTVNIISDIMGGLLPTPYGDSVSIRNSGIVNITGSIAGYSRQGVIVDTISGGTINISGSIRGNYIRVGGGNISYGIVINTNKTINIIGNVSSEAGSNGNGIVINGNVIIDIKGNVFNNASTTLNALTLSTGTSTLTITGSIYQFPTSTATTIINIGGTSCNVRISGSITSGNTSVAINHATAGTSSIIGPISASLSSAGVSFTSATHFLSATGPFYNKNNHNAVYAQNLQLISGSTPTWTFNTETTLKQRTLYVPNYPGNFPSISDVRQGTIFGDANQYTGTIIIPSSSDVLKGVLLDNTTGSASFTVQNAWIALTGSLTATGSIGERLKNASLVSTDGVALTTENT